MIIDDTNKRIYFRQSWLSTAQRCPEEGRLAIVSPELEVTTDEAIIGTAAHYAIEQVILGAADPALIEEAVAHFYSINVEEFRFTKRSSITEMIELSQRCARAWVEDLAPKFDLQDCKTEVKFSVPLFAHRGWDVYIQGTTDLAPACNELVDWKTSGSDYKQKDKQKWDTQSAIYALAAVNGGIRDDIDYQWPVPFRFGVMIKRVNKCRGQIVEVQRTQAHGDWAMRRMETWVDVFLDLGLGRSWPMIDEGNYLCSKRWCSFYDQCRGAHVTTDMDLFGWNPA